MDIKGWTRAQCCRLYVPEMYGVGVPPLGRGLLHALPAETWKQLEIPRDLLSAQKCGRNIDKRNSIVCHSGGKWRKIAIALALIQQLSLNGNAAGNLLLTYENISEMEKCSPLFSLVFHDVILCANDRLCAKLVFYAPKWLLENNVLHRMMVPRVSTWFSLCN